MKRYTDKPTQQSQATTPLAALSKTALHVLANRLRSDTTSAANPKNTAEAVEQCVAFIEAETLGYWHNRARAMMARRLKHCRLTQDQRDRLLRAIMLRLVSGRFAQQFKDQLRLALALDTAHVQEVARSRVRASEGHVRRYAEWLLAFPRTPSAA